MSEHGMQGGSSLGAGRMRITVVGAAAIVFALLVVVYVLRNRPALQAESDGQ